MKFAALLAFGFSRAWRASNLAPADLLHRGEHGRDSKRVAGSSEALEAAYGGTEIALAGAGFASQTSGANSEQS